MDIAWSIMFWPLVACLTLPALLVYFGLHIVRRGVIFVDLALAQVATLGTCVCIMLGHDPHDIHGFYYSVGFTLLGALIFALSRNDHDHRIPQEAVIGVVYVVAAAAAILLLSRTPEGNEELKRTLVGDVLTVTPEQVGWTMGLFLVIAIAHWVFRKPFMAITFRAASSPERSWSVRGWDFLFYALFGAVVTSFVKIGGVLLVFSYLIVPALCANLLARSFAFMLLAGCLISMLGSACGLWASYRFDLPAGGAIVCSLGLMLVAVAAIQALRRRSSPDRP